MGLAFPIPKRWELDFSFPFPIPIGGNKLGHFQFPIANMQALFPLMSAVDVNTPHYKLLPIHVVLKPPILFCFDFSKVKVQWAEIVPHKVLMGSYSSAQLN